MHHRKKTFSIPSGRQGPHKLQQAYFRKIKGPPKVSSLHLAMLSLRFSSHKQYAAARYSCTCSVNV